MPPVVPVDSLDDNSVPPQSPVIPNVVHETVSSDDVFTVHLRPLFTTVVRLPEEVTSIAIGAPTLIAAEHDKAEPRLVDLKPMTYGKIDSNVVIALRSGHTLSIRVISDGEEDSTTPVDFVVDYTQPHSLFLGSESPGESSAPSEADPGPSRRSASPVSEGSGTEPAHSGLRGKRNRTSEPTSLITDSTPVAENQLPLDDPTSSPTGSSLDVLFQEQEAIAAPRFILSSDLARAYHEDKHASSDLAVSIGRSFEQGDSMFVAYSVVNNSHKWVEVLPPLLEFNNPNTGKNGKVNKKHPAALAEQLFITDYRMSRSKLAPGQRLDADVEFVRPGFKYQHEHLLLQVANASEVDAAVYFPVPFVPAGR
jgi:hypothetical protein